MILRVEQLILLQSRFRLTNQAVTEFTEQLLLEIERKHYDSGENSISPNGFPREFAPKQDVVGISLLGELKYRRYTTGSHTREGFKKKEVL